MLAAQILNNANIFFFKFLTQISVYIGCFSNKEKKYPAAVAVTAINTNIYKGLAYSH